MEHLSGARGSAGLLASYALVLRHLDATGAP